MFNIQEKLAQIGMDKREQAAKAEVTRIMEACKADGEMRIKAFENWDGFGRVPVSTPSYYQINLVKAEVTAKLFMGVELVTKITEGFPLVEFEKELVNHDWEPFVNQDGQNCYFMP